MKTKGLKYYHKNPRTLSKKQYELLKRDLEELGDLSGIVHDLNTNEIIGGNQRTRIFNEENSEIIINKVYDKPTRTGTVAEGHVLYKDEKFSYRQVKWTKEQCEKANIIANKAGGSWDFDILANEFEIEDLIEWGFEAEELGIDTSEEESIDDDFVPEIKKDVVTVKGDLYELGEHRVLCGDSTVFDEVEKLMDGDKADMVFTDPPYGIDVVKNNKVGADFGIAKKGNYKKVIGDNTTDTANEFYKTCIALSMEKFIIWGGNYFTDFLLPSKSWLIWNKRGDSGIKNTFSDAELAWSNIGFPCRVHNQLWNGMIREGESDKRIHPTQKPLNLIIYGMDLLKDNKLVYDGFLGSGSTLIACEKTDRKCFGMELDEHYCDVIVMRYINYCKKNNKEISIKRNGKDVDVKEFEGDKKC